MMSAERLRPRLGLAVFILIAPLGIHPASLAADPIATIQESNGASYAASIVGFEGQAVKIAIDGQARQIEFTQLSSIEFPSSGENEAANQPKQFKVQLRNGSLLDVDKLESDGQQVSVEYGKRPFVMQPSQIAWIQIGTLDDEQAASWQQLISSEINSDILVVKQPSGALTKIDGIVLGITPEAVSFEFGGTSLPVPFERLAGVRFFTAVEASMGNASGTLTDQAGNRWVFSSITSADRTAAAPNSESSQVLLGLPGQASVELTFSALKSINFSAGNRRYLTELELVRQSADRIFDFDLPDVDSSRLLGVRALPPVDLPGESRGPSLQFLGGGEAVYEIPAGFNRLTGSVELRPLGTHFTPCIIEIFVERELRWTDQLPAPREPKTFDLPVESGKRLRLVVRSTAPLATGNVVVWQAPSLLK